MTPQFFRKMNKFRTVILNLIKYLTALVVGLILLVNIVRDKSISYVYKNASAISNIILAIIAIGVILIFYVVNQKRTSAKKTVISPVVFAVSTILLLILELAISWYMYFETGWDCGYLVSTARKIAVDGGVIGSDLYFSQHSNNVLLVAILSGIIKMTRMLGFNSSTADYYSLVIVSCMMVNLAGILLWDCIRIKKDTFCAYFAWLMYALLVGLSPWISIPYSDTYTIIFPILCLWIYIRFIEYETKNIKLGVAFFLVTSISVIGYYIKPTVILMLISIIFLELINVIFDSVKAKREKTVKILLCTLGLVVGFISGTSINNVAKIAMGCNLDSELDFGPAHYFFMGANYDVSGTYDQWDNNFTAGFSDKKSRNRADLEAGIQRIKDMGPRKYLVHNERKLLVNFNDGTFSWENEGAFYKGMQIRTGTAADIIRGIYYDPPHGGRENGILSYKSFNTFMQLLWMLLLILFFISLIGKENRKSQAVSIARLSVLAIFIFVMVFEARARYLFLYSPIIIVAAVLGFDSSTGSILTLIHGRLKNLKGHENQP